MKKAEILKRYQITKLDGITVFIKSKEFDFSYTIVTPEAKGEYRYFGGLQSGYHEESPEHKQLEKWLCEIAEMVLDY